MLPTQWKTISLNLAKPSSFHITNEIFGLSAVKTTSSLACLVRDTLSSSGPFCMFRRHLKLARKKYPPGLFSSVTPWTCWVISHGFLNEIAFVGYMCVVSIREKPFTKLKSFLFHFFENKCTKKRQASKVCMHTVKLELSWLEDQV